MCNQNVTGMLYSNNVINICNQNVIDYLYNEVKNQLVVYFLKKELKVWLKKKKKILRDHPS
jgi:hypothetical protein